MLFILFVMISGNVPSSAGLTQNLQTKGIEVDNATAVWNHSWRLLIVHTARQRLEIFSYRECNRCGHGVHWWPQWVNKSPFSCRPLPLPTKWWRWGSLNTWLESMTSHPSCCYGAWSSNIGVSTSELIRARDSLAMHLNRFKDSEDSHDMVSSSNSLGNPHDLDSSTSNTKI